MSVLTNSQKKALIEAGESASNSGWPLMFIKRMDWLELRKADMTYGFSIRLNGKPFSNKGDKKGRIRTRKFETVTDITSLADYIDACAAHIAETSGVYGLNVLVDMPEDPEYVADTDLTEKEVNTLMDELRELETLSRKGLWKLCAGSWDNKLHTQDKGTD